MKQSIQEILAEVVKFAEYKKSEKVIQSARAGLYHHLKRTPLKLCWGNLFKMV